MTSQPASERPSATLGNDLVPEHASLVMGSATRLIQWWTRPDFACFYIPTLLFLILIAAICLARAVIGLSGMKMATQDAFPVIDGAWRLMNGQRPHLDFYSGLGPVVYLVCEAGLLLARGAYGYGYAQALFGLVVALWTYLVTTGRVGKIASGLLSVFVALLATAPFTVGDLPHNLSPDMTYNRYGYALLVILLVEALCTYRENRNSRQFSGGFSSGLVLVILLFLKITYFLAASFLICALLPLRLQTRARLTGIAVGFVAGFLPFLAFLRFNLVPMFHDLQMIGRARHLSPSRILLYGVETLQNDLVGFAAFVLGLALVLWCFRGTASSRRIILAVVAVCGIGLMLIFTNAQVSGLPLNVALAIILFDTMIWRLREEELSPFDALKGVAVLAMAAGTLMVAAVPMMCDTVGLGDGLYMCWGLATGREHYPKFDAVKFEGFRDYEGEIVRSFNDGALLLRQNRKPNETLFVLDFCNPYSYAFNIKPAYGGSTWLQWRINLDDKHKPAPQWLLGYADLILVPKSYHQPVDNDNLPRVYGSYIHQNYALIAQSGLWELYRRNQPGDEN